jgi:glycosyltransferase involved in cell wall biosynthesis
MTQVVQRPGITALIACKNEQHNITDCVLSAWLVADEVLLADSRSTDQTIELARGLGCRVIQRDLVNLGNFKNWAIPQAKFPWVFVLDADERMSLELAAEIHRTLESQPQYDGYWVYRQNYFMGNPVRFGGWGRDRVIRLFRRDVARYAEHTDHTEIQLPAHRLGKLSSRLTHFTCWSYDEFLWKMNRYTEQQARLWVQEGRRPSRLSLIANGPLRFVRDYFVHQGFLDGSVGFQLAALTGFYSFLKQARFWQMYYSCKIGKRCWNLSHADPSFAIPYSPFAIHSANATGESRTSTEPRVHGVVQ